MTINLELIAKANNTTLKRVQTIYSQLFGDAELPADVAELHITGVLERIKQHKETVAIACDRYIKEAEKQQKKSGKNGNGADTSTGKGSIQERLKKDRETTKKLTQARFVAIVQESNKKLADWLQNGINEDELTPELRAALSDSEDEVMDALTSVIDVEGNYVIDEAPKLAQPSIIGWLPPSQPEHLESIGVN